MFRDKGAGVYTIIKLDLINCRRKYYSCNVPLPNNTPHFALGIFGGRDLAIKHGSALAIEQAAMMIIPNREKNLTLMYG